VPIVGTEPPDSQSVVYARAVSILNSKTFWTNAGALLIAIIVLPEVGSLIPERFVPIYSALLAIANIILRLVTVRPVSLTAPGSVTVVEIPKINPPASKMVA
jgi:hypothetical protein